MAISLRHKLTATGAPRQITPTAWNDTHVMTGTPNKFLGFDISGNIAEFDGTTPPSVLPLPGVFRVDDYVPGTTAALNTAGFNALRIAVEANGGGIIRFTPGKVYLVGQQSFRSPVYQLYYSFFPDTPLLQFTAPCPKGIFIEGNGATIRCAPGLGYGVFEPASATLIPKATTPGYQGTGAAIPYEFMISIRNCTGPIEISNIELDGNNKNLAIGGGFSDTGIQLKAGGLDLHDNTGGGKFWNMYSHHHGLDGIQISGPGITEGGAAKSRFHFSSCKFEWNGRLGMALVGGSGLTFTDCAFNWNANNVTTGGAPGIPISTAPASGVDHESEGGKVTRDIKYFNCEFIGNMNTQVVCDSGTPVKRVMFEQCKFTQTNSTAYAIWVNRPDFKFRDCTIYGTVTNMWTGTTDNVNPTMMPFEAAQFEGCRFSNDPTNAPTGYSVKTINRQMIEGANFWGGFRRCVFEHADSSGNCSQGSIDTTLYEDCTFICRNTGPSAFAAFYGRFKGTGTHFISEGAGSIQALPRLNGVGAGTAGEAENWYRRTIPNATIATPLNPPVTTILPASINPTTGALL